MIILIIAKQFKFVTYNFLCSKKYFSCFTLHDCGPVNLLLQEKKTLNFTRSEESKTLHNNFNSSKTNYLCVKQFFVVAENNFSLPCTGHINLPLPKKTPNVITLSIPRRNVPELISRIKMVLLKYSATVKTQRCLST